MGSIPSKNLSANDLANSTLRPSRDSDHGVGAVVVKVSTGPSASGKKPPDQSFTVTSRGAIFYGNRRNPKIIQQAMVGMLYRRQKYFHGILCLKDEALAFDSLAAIASLAADEHDLEEDALPSAQPDTSGVANGERFVCYMCYETHDTEEDPLVAPCECKGDTRYLHVQCLQKWYQSSVGGARSLVMRTTGNGLPACKICGTAYRSAFKKADGKISNLLKGDDPGPYVSMVVVTHNESCPELFNTKFKMNFARSGAAPQVDDLVHDILVSYGLTIGRMTNCNMVLDDKTVSGVHAKVTYTDNNFYLEDCASSNGTMIYLKNAIALSNTAPVRVRMGKSTITMQSSRSWTSTLQSLGGWTGAKVAPSAVVTTTAPPVPSNNLSNKQGGLYNNTRSSLTPKTSLTAQDYYTLLIQANANDDSSSWSAASCKRRPTANDVGSAAVVGRVPLARVAENDEPSARFMTAARPVQQLLGDDDEDEDGEANSNSVCDDMFVRGGPLVGGGSSTGAGQMSRQESEGYALPVPMSGPSVRSTSCPDIIPPTRSSFNNNNNNQLTSSPSSMRKAGSASNGLSATNVMTSGGAVVQGGGLVVEHEPDMAMLLSKSRESCAKSSALQGGEEEEALAAPAVTLNRHVTGAAAKHGSGGDNTSARKYLIDTETNEEKQICAEDKSS